MITIHSQFISGMFAGFMALAILVLTYNIGKLSQ